MGRALAQAALGMGHRVTIVSGPVHLEYPRQAKVISVVSTEEMFAAARQVFESCDGLIGAAAPCDYRPVRVESHKIAKTGQPLSLMLVETPDVVATLGAEKKSGQWVVGFALETQDRRIRAIAKLAKKSCDLIVVNGASAIDSPENSVEILDRRGRVVQVAAGSKEHVAEEILRAIQQRLVEPDAS
jgi:phosphopantothenoylcysteine decarboxylase/phosphopantothenate--cysteine ligase